ncbi:MAG: hypothetical protein KatS3mg056_2069 [Chloroflexus sp.]|nr:MAG: hypothetical protein KatS3mg056_2069 [Chloroflexus sp.]
MNWQSRTGVWCNRCEGINCRPLISPSSRPLPPLGLCMTHNANTAYPRTGAGRRGDDWRAPQPGAGSARLQRTHHRNTGSVRLRRAWCRYHCWREEPGASSRSWERAPPAHSSPEHRERAPPARPSPEHRERAPPAHSSPEHWERAPPVRIVPAPFLEGRARSKLPKLGAHASGAPITGTLGARASGAHSAGTIPGARSKEQTPAPGGIHGRPGQMIEPNVYLIRKPWIKHLPSPLPPPLSITHTWCQPRAEWIALPACHTRGARCGVRQSCCRARRPHDPAHGPPLTRLVTKMPFVLVTIVESVSH